MRITSAIIWMATPRSSPVTWWLFRGASNDGAGHAERIARSRSRLGPPTELTEGRQPNFSSNGQWVVYNHQENIYKMQTISGTAEPLTDTGHDSYPHWGWANDKIVFQRYANGGYDIYVYVVP